MAEPARIYDKDDEKPVTRPDLKSIDGGGETSEPKRGHLSAVGDEKNKKSLSPEQLANAEEAGAEDTIGGSAAGTEQSQLPTSEGQIGPGYNPTDKPRGLSRLRGALRGGKLSRRKKLVLGIAALFVTGGAAMSFLLAPTFVVNHLREIISGRISQLQVHQSRKYRRSKISKFSDLFSKDGRIGGKMIAELEARGYHFTYEPGTNKVKGLTLPNGQSTLVKEAIGDHIDDYMEIKHPLRTSRWKTKRTNALYRRFGISRTSVVAATSEAIDDPDTAVNKKIAQNTLDEPVELKGKPEEIPPDETAAQKAAREAREAAIKDASTTGGPLGETRAGILEGLDEDAAARRAGFDAGADAVEQLGEGAGAAALKTATEIATKASFASKLFGAFKSFLSPTDVLDKVCTLKGRLRMSVVAARNYRALALLKYASVFIGVGDATRTGKVNPKLMSSVMKRVTSVDRNGNAIGASPGFAYAIKGKFSKSKSDSSKGAYGVDGSLTGTWKGVQDATGTIPGTSTGQCAVIQNVIFQGVSTVVMTVGKAALCVISIGTGCAAEQAIESGTRLAVTDAVKAAIQNSIRNIFTKQTLKALAISEVFNLSFEGILVLTQLHIEKALALPLTTQERGAQLGSILVAGGGVGNKQRSLQGGDVPTTTEQYKQAEGEFMSWKKDDLSKQSLFARLLNVNNPDSLAFSLAARMPVGLSSTASFVRSGLSDNVASFLSGGFLVSSLGTVFSGRVHADDEVSYDGYTLEAGSYKGKEIAVDFAGNPLVVLRPDIEAVDPEENIASLSASGDIDPSTLEIKSDRFKNHVANCVDTIDIISRIEFESDPSSPDMDCMAENPLTIRFKAHLAFLDMIDGVEAEFSPESI